MKILTHSEWAKLPKWKKLKSESGKRYVMEIDPTTGATVLTFAAVLRKTRVK